MQSHIIICVCGGLGNQFFQYATAYTVAKNNNYKLLIDSTAYYGYIWNEICGYQLNNIIPNLEETKHPFYCKFLEMSKPIRWAAILIKQAHYKLRKKYVEKTSFSYNSSINNIKPNTYLYGYFQSYKYFANYSDDIINMFSKLSLSQAALKIVYKLEQQSNPTVAIHFRDYTDPRAGGNEELFQSILLNANYYRQAIEIINKKYKNATFYVFSNKASTARKVLQEIDNLEFIEYHVFLVECILKYQ